MTEDLAPQEAPQPVATALAILRKERLVLVNKKEVVEQVLIDLDEGAPYAGQSQDEVLTLSLATICELLKKAMRDLNSAIGRLEQKE